MFQTLGCKTSVPIPDDVKIISPQVDCAEQFCVIAIDNHKAVVSVVFSCAQWVKITSLLPWLTILIIVSDSEISPFVRASGCEDRRADGMDEGNESGGVGSQNSQSGVCGHSG